MFRQTGACLDRTRITVVERKSYKIRLRFAEPEVMCPCLGRLVPDVAHEWAIEKRAGRMSKCSREGTQDRQIGP